MNTFLPGRAEINYPGGFCLLRKFTLFLPLYRKRNLTIGTATGQVIVHMVSDHQRKPLHIHKQPPECRCGALTVLPQAVRMKRDIACNS